MLRAPDVSPPTSRKARSRASPHAKGGRAPRSSARGASPARATSSAGAARSAIRARRAGSGADAAAGTPLTCELAPTTGSDPYAECAVGTCGPGLGDGEECDATLEPCAVGLSCLPPHAEAPGPSTCRRGEEGTLDGPCLDHCPRGTFCDRDGFVCRQQSAAGGPCTSYAGIADPQCGWRTMCAYRTCRSIGVVTEPCDPDATPASCADGVDCKTVSRTCVERPTDAGPADAGEPCGGLAPSCTAGLTCARFGVCRVCP